MNAERTAKSQPPFELMGRKDDGKESLKEEFLAFPTTLVEGFIW